MAGDVGRLRRPAILAACLLAALPVAAAAAPRTIPGPTRATSYSARIVVPTVATGRPAGGSVRGLLDTAARYTGGTNRLLVLGSRRGPQGRLWLRVRLPVRPNGAEGWIPGDHAVIRRNAWRVEVSTARRLAVVLRDGRVVRRLPVGVGAPATPTPHGLFAVSEKFATTQRGVGRWVLALTAHSEVLRSFAGGPGLVALHGRSGRGLPPVRSHRSKGCVVFENADTAWLMRTLPPGTPVLIRA
jgi:lipoprotein-anchoring transpeptidase ErfK/SrfK